MSEWFPFFTGTRHERALTDGDVGPVDAPLTWFTLNAHGAAWEGEKSTSGRSGARWGDGVRKPQAASAENMGAKSPTTRIKSPIEWDALE